VPPRSNVQEARLKRKINQEKKEKSYKKQKEASDEENKHTSNLYSTKIYNVL